MRVLIVDDDLEIRTCLSDILQEAGYEVNDAEDGEVALALLRRGGYDVVLLDLVMPRLSGVEVLRRLPVGAPPIVVATGMHQLPDLSRAAAVLRKPYDLDELLTVLRRVLEDGKERNAS